MLSSYVCGGTLVLWHWINFHLVSICLISEEETDDIKVSKQLEIEGVQAAESGEIESALNLFSRAIQNTPQRASGYNNRAQALRLKGDIQGKCIMLWIMIFFKKGFIYILINFYILFYGKPYCSVGQFVC